MKISAALAAAAIGVLGLTLPVTAAGPGPGGGFGGRLGGPGFRGSVGAPRMRAGAPVVSRGESAPTVRRFGGSVGRLPRTPLGFGNRGFPRGDFGFRPRGFDRRDFRHRDFDRHRSSVIIGLGFGFPFYGYGGYPFSGYGGYPLYPGYPYPVYPYSAYPPSYAYEPGYARTGLLEDLIVRWRGGDDLQVEWYGGSAYVSRVEFSLLDAGGYVLATRAERTRPYATTFYNVPDRAVSLQISVVYSDGTADTAVRGLP